MNESPTKTGNKVGAPMLPAEKKRTCGYVLHLSFAEKAAVEEFANRRGMKPAEIFHSAARSFIDSEGKGFDPGEQKPVHPDDKTTCYLNLTADEKTAIMDFIRSKKKMTIVSFFREAAKQYIIRLSSDSCSPHARG